MNDVNCVTVNGSSNRRFYTKQCILLTGDGLSVHGCFRSVAELFIPNDDESHVSDCFCDCVSLLHVHFDGG